MSDKSAIEWTDATWNPVTGCTKVSPGCDHCYAETFAERWRGKPGHYYERGFDVQLRPEKLDQPLRWKRPRRVFVNSMSDLFHDAISDEFIARVFAAMAQTPQHTYQLLTKRHARMRSLLTSETFRVWTIAAQREVLAAGKPGCVPVVSAWPLPNLWLVVSVESQRWADIRIPALLETPAAVRGISCEPLLGPVDLTPYLAHQCDCPGPGHRRMSEYGPRLDWVVVGGESGPRARPMHPSWARGLRDQCTASGVPFFFKQWGEWGPAPWVVRVCDPAEGWTGTEEELRQAKAHAEAIGATHAYPVWAYRYDHEPYEPPHKPWSTERTELDAAYAPIRRWGKRVAGRELDGRTWDQYPEAVSNA